MGVLLVLRSHFPPQPVDKFFGGGGRWGASFVSLSAKMHEPVLWE